MITACFEARRLRCGSVVTARRLFDHVAVALLIVFAIASSARGDRIRELGTPEGAPEVTISGSQQDATTAKTILSADLTGPAGMPDGIDDLVVAEPRGLVHVIAAPVTTMDLAAPPSRVITFSGDSGFGESVAVGDVNGDGLPDLLIASPSALAPAEAGVGGRGGAGKVEVFPGPITPLSPALEPTLTVFGVSQGDFLGRGAVDAGHATHGKAIAAGDVDGDGIDDLVLGAREMDRPALIHPESCGSGAVFVLFGRQSWPAATWQLHPQLDGADVVILGRSGQVLVFPFENSCHLADQATGGDSLGEVVRVTDLNGDGVEDVLLGAPQAQVGASHDGAAYVIFGRSRSCWGLAVPPWQHAGDPPAHWNWDGYRIWDLAAMPADVTVIGRGVSKLGFSIAAGDVIAGASLELVIGAPADEGPRALPSLSQRGAVHVFCESWGSAQPNACTHAPVNFPLATVSSSMELLGAEAGDRAGVAVEIGDLEPGGAQELVIGSPGHHPPPTGSDRGRTYQACGPLDCGGAVQVLGPKEPGDLAHVFTIEGIALDDQDSNTIEDFMGDDLAIGDYDLDGRPDLVIAASHADVEPDRVDVGEVYVLYSRDCTCPDGTLFADAGPDQLEECTAVSEHVVPLLASAGGQDYATAWEVNAGEGDCPHGTAITWDPSAAPAVLTIPSDPLDPCPATCIATLTVTTCAGDEATDSVTVVIDDTLPPAFTSSLPDLTVDCNVPDPSTVQAWDACDGVIQPELDEVITSGSCPHEYTITRTWTATDACDNSVTHVQTIEVRDDEPPSVTCDPGREICNDSFLRNSRLPDPNPSAVRVSDNCSSRSEIVIEHVSDAAEGDCPRTVTRTYRATDACGNVAECTQVFVLPDPLPPMIDAPLIDPIPCGVSTHPDDLGWATATDDCTPSQDIVIEFRDAPSERGDPCFTLFTRTWTATDSRGNFSILTQHLRISKPLPPPTFEATATSPMGLPPLSPCVGLPTVTYTNTSDHGGCPVEEEPWDFGVGAIPSTATGHDPPDPVLYVTPGRKEPSLTVRTGTCESTTEACVCVPGCVSVSAVSAGDLTDFIGGCLPEDCEREDIVIHFAVDGLSDCCTDGPPTLLPGSSMTFTMNCGGSSATIEPAGLFVNAAGEVVTRIVYACVVEAFREAGCCGFVSPKTLSIDGTLLLECGDCAIEPIRLYTGTMPVPIPGGPVPHCVCPD